MLKASVYTLKLLKRIYGYSFNTKKLTRPDCDKDPESVSRKISEILSADFPCMIGRFGAYELDAVVNYLGTRNPSPKIIKYIQGNLLPWWWEKRIFNQLYNNTGFFPPVREKIERFCEMMIQDLTLLDILGSWLPEEHYFESKLKDCHKVDLELLNPYFSKEPWTTVLEGKKVLVVHPFAKTIQAQYKKRDRLFANNLLPSFELKTIKAVQSSAGEKVLYSDWFKALDFMKSEIDRTDFDISLTGCGAYGFPLAAHVKRIGKKGFHMGGSLQLLFGIKGRRWEDVNYNKTYNYARLMNEYWVRPGPDETPTNPERVENACYW